MNAQAAIEVEKLVREFRKGPRAVDGIDLMVSPGEIYGFLGPNGAGKSTTVLMLTTLLPPTSGRATVGGYDIVTQGSQVRASIGAALQEAALDPILTGREHLHAPGHAAGTAGSRATAARPSAARARRTDRGGRPSGRRLLGRNEAPAGPGAGARALAPDPVPGRADHRPGPAEPQRALGGGRAAGPRRGHDRVPHHPVSGRGRRPGRPDRDHRQRADRRRGDARAGSRRRSAARASR